MAIIALTKTSVTDIHVFLCSRHSNYMLNMQVFTYIRIYTEPALHHRTEESAFQHASYTQGLNHAESLAPATAVQT